MDTRSKSLTLVIDIGKTHAKLLLIDAEGEVQEQHSRNNASVLSPLGYPALDVHGLELWMIKTLRASKNAKFCSRAIASTHGAAFVALSDDGLAWEPLDYEWDALATRPDLRAVFSKAADPYELTFSPELPAGLNAASQLFSVQHLYPLAWKRTRYLLPYAQYWAWKLSGQFATEVTSLGCHTHLWDPYKSCFSAMACQAGWDKFFPPLRSAWEVLGCVQSEVVQNWGLPEGCQVHVGVHDSNACLARYFVDPDSKNLSQNNLTVVSSGTWTVLMAPGASTLGLHDRDDMLANVDVLGRVTPTARFMGGREFETILEDALPEEATVEGIQKLLKNKVQIMPSWTQQGGPFRRLSGHVMSNENIYHSPIGDHFTNDMRASMAALYCAQVTVYLINRLWRNDHQVHSRKCNRVVIDGPLVKNKVYLSVVQALIPFIEIYINEESLEGTARGAWILANWTEFKVAEKLKKVQKFTYENIESHYAEWLKLLDGK